MTEQLKLSNQVGERGKGKEKETEKRTGVIEFKANKKVDAAKAGILAAAASGGFALMCYKILQSRKEKHNKVLGSRENWHKHFTELKYEPEHFTQDEVLFDMFGLVWMLSERDAASFHAVKQAVLGLDSLMRIEFVLENKDAEPTLIDLERATSLATFIVHALGTVKNLRSSRAYNALEAAKSRIERTVLDHTLLISSLVYDCD